MTLNDLVQLNLTLAGEAQRLSADNLNVESFIITAAAGNTDLVYIGSSSVSNARFVKALAPGESWSASVDVSSSGDSSYFNLKEIWWDGDTNDNKLNVGYMTA